MNVQAQMSGQFSGQINQTGNQMRGQHMQNGILLNPQMQNGRSNMSMVDAEVVQKRKIMRRMIYEMLMRKRQQVNEGSQKKCQDITGLLEEGLFKSATSMEEYMNMDTLGIRLHAFLKRMQPTNQAPQHSQFISTPTAVCTMIPTPGLEHHANSSVVGSATVDPTMMTADTRGRTTPSTGSLMPAVNESFSGIRGGAFRTAEGSLSNGHQQVASSFSANFGGSNMMVAQRPMNQMIPTPGFNGSNNQILSKMDTSNNNGMLSRVDSSVVSQQVPQRQANGQRSRMVQNTGSGIKSSVQQGFQNGSSNGGSGNNVNGASRPLLHPHNQLHQPTVQGDSSGPVNFCNQSVNQLRTSATSRPNSLMNSQLNTQPASNIRPHMAEQVTKSGHLQTPQSIMSDGRTNGYSGKHAGAQSGALVHNDCHSGNGRFSLAAQLPDKQHVQVDFQQGIVGHEEAQCLNLSAGVSSNGQIVAPDRARQYRNQVKWLLFLYHARWCRAPAGKCPDSHCIIAQKLLEHLDSCKASPCSYPRCSHSKSMLDHLRSCRKSDCAVCVPYKKFILARKKLNTRRDLDGLQHSINGPLKSSEAGKIEAVETIRSTESAVEAPENQPSVKRMKSEPSSQSLASMNGTLSMCNVISASHAGNDNYMQIDPEHPGVKAEISSSSNHNGPEINNTTFNIASSRHLDSGSALDEMSSLPSKNAVKPEKDNDQSKAEEVVEPFEQGPGIISGKPTIKGVSLMEMFTPEQVQEHITGLKQWIGQSRAKVEKNQALEQRMTENSCQLCAVETLSFEPPPIYCTPCGARIKRNAMYYTMGAGDTRHCFCIPCYNEFRGDTIPVDGTAVSKSKMQKKKNDEEIDEPWVQCDKCIAWQHQICALFNGRRNESGEAEYTCPNCYLKEIEQGVRLPLPQSAVLLAKDLPGTALSDHIELRLAGRLKQERQERAKSQGKSYDEVPGVEGVVVRVVSSVDKKLEVKPLFLEIFREQNYPSEFPYKSKVVLLFQKIDGVEVCLFGMYVQEFGSECLPPNQRRVYVSYLDSVKYFRPDVKTVTGEALRTFVYHEILIGYLEYCKKRGFASCYIWACPPLKGEDYILYCHPEIQKTPRSDKLREWYLAMLRKASRENIVVGLTNLYDHFFIQSGECKAKVTAARLPYFDGDYWPGAAEDLISQINQEEEARKQNKKGATRKLITKRALKASGQLDLSSNVSKDVVLMHKLGESIAPMKEDFIMVHLQHACTHCCVLMVSGHRWVCELCKNFQLCDRCYLEEEKRDDRERHPIYQKVKHGLMKMEITDVPEDTKDKDEIVESEFFDTRQAFLSLCQGNHYQYDTLRRAKHSSMMVLYHLHNPTAPAFVTTCHICRLDIETGQGWRCETCPDFDVCNACYQKEGGVDHPHKLTNHPSVADRNAQNKEARQMRVVQLRKMLDLLVHASHCTIGQCPYQNCRKVKTLFRHAINCAKRASGGCHLCIRMWHLLRLHARTCKESACRVPRCRDLRDHLKRMQQQSDSRRRAAVKEMMRQRTREVTGKA